MKLIRFGEKGRERPGMVDGEGEVRDIGGAVRDVDPAALSSRALDALRGRNPEDFPVVARPGRVGACVTGVRNFHAVGLNYARHAAEAGLDLPKEPILFSKATSCIGGPDDRIPVPPGSAKLDWEVELGVVIGREAWQISEARALDHVAGYCTMNDVSERAFQMERGGQWIKGKSAPGFGPVGPWLCTADEVPDPQNLTLSLDLNGETVQSSSTADMIFGVAEIIAYMSRFMVLLPGDLIATGTPSGVGLGMKPPRFLAPGDVLEVEVEGLGRQRQEVVPG